MSLNIHHDAIENRSDVRIQVDPSFYKNGTVSSKFSYSNILESLCFGNPVAFSHKRSLPLMKTIIVIMDALDSSSKIATIQKI